MRDHERFRWSLWPVATGWLLAGWIAWEGFADLLVLLKGDYPARGFVFGFLSSWPRPWQTAFAILQIATFLLALPSIAGFATRRTLLAIGSSGLTFDRWIGWRRIEWPDIVRLEFSFGDAVFHLRDNGKITTFRFRPWTIGLDSDEFRDLVERHEPRLTPDEDEGQPWGRSSSFIP